MFHGPIRGRIGAPGSLIIRSTLHGARWQGPAELVGDVEYRQIQGHAQTPLVEGTSCRCRQRPSHLCQAYFAVIVHRLFLPFTGSFGIKSLFPPQCGVKFLTHRLRSSRELMRVTGLTAASGQPAPLSCWALIDAHSDQEVVDTRKQSDDPSERSLGCGIGGHLPIQVRLHTPRHRSTPV